jgi:hypothetical protein
MPLFTASATSCEASLSVADDEHLNDVGGYLLQRETTQLSDGPTHVPATNLTNY